ncbi:MAG: aminotransferase class V-fold PLP-dependent enzyme [Bacteroidota bacterium]
MPTNSTLDALTCQRDLFTLDAGNGFLNGAYMAPQLKSVHAAGNHALLQKNDPTAVLPEDFFAPVVPVKEAFAKLVEVDDVERIALIPAVSYGVATVAKNLPLTAGQNIVIAAEQFPSNYYSWQKKCAEVGAELRVINRPVDATNAQEQWNADLLAAIDDQTALLALAALHWADGTLWDLPALRKATHNVGAWLFIDGTQSVGALPFSVRDIQPDALVCAGYKWLMGPYSTAYAYYGPVFDEGHPLEENWINRHNSDDFRGLVDYESRYRPKAGRYCVGQHSNFILLPMQLAALQQLLAWQPERIQHYCAGLWTKIRVGLAELGIYLPEKRAQHLVGLRLPQHLKAEKLPSELAKRRIKLSFRGDAIRVSPNVYNRADEMERLLDALYAIR